jgi:hypothetical protein
MSSTTFWVVTLCSAERVHLTFCFCSSTLKTEVIFSSKTLGFLRTDSTKDLHLLISYLAYSSILKVKAMCSSETSALNWLSLLTASDGFLFGLPFNSIDVELIWLRKVRPSWNWLSLSSDPTGSLLGVQSSRKIRGDEFSWNVEISPN